MILINDKGRILKHSKSHLLDENIEFLKIENAFELNDNECCYDNWKEFLKNPET